LTSGVAKVRYLCATLSVFAENITLIAAGALGFQ